MALNRRFEWTRECLTSEVSLNLNFGGVQAVGFGFQGQAAGYSRATENDHRLAMKDAALCALVRRPVFQIRVAESRNGPRRGELKRDHLIRIWLRFAFLIDDLDFNVRETLSAGSDGSQLWSQTNRRGIAHRL